MPTHVLSTFNTFSRVSTGAAWSGVASPATTFNVDTGTVAVGPGSAVVTAQALTDDGGITSDVITSVLLSFDWAQTVSVGTKQGIIEFAIGSNDGSTESPVVVVPTGSVSGSVNQEVIGLYGSGSGATQITRAHLFAPGPTNAYSLALADDGSGSYSLRIQITNLQLSVTYTTPPAPPTLTPSTGPVAGDTTVTIRGTGLTATTGVRFDGIAAAFTIVSDTELRAISPAHAAGAVSVVVAGAGVTLPFTYALSASKLPPIPRVR